MLRALITEPKYRLVYNAPFIARWVNTIRITNQGAEQIGWRATANTSVADTLRAVPSSGVLDSQESQFVQVTCPPFDVDPSSVEDAQMDRLIFEWVATPSTNKGKVFQGDWFEEADVSVKRYSMLISYNS